MALFRGQSNVFDQNLTIFRSKSLAFWRQIGVFWSKLRIFWSKKRRNLIKKLVPFYELKSSNFDQKSSNFDQILTAHESAIQARMPGLELPQSFKRTKLFVAFGLIGTTLDQPVNSTGSAPQCLQRGHPGDSIPVSNGLAAGHLYSLVSEHGRKNFSQRSVELYNSWWRHRSTFPTNLETCFSKKCFSIFDQNNGFLIKIWIKIRPFSN